jgi:hypothetical protein
MGNFWKNVGRGFKGRSKYERNAPQRAKTKAEEAAARQEQRNQHNYSILPFVYTINQIPHCIEIHHKSCGYQNLLT